MRKTGNIISIIISVISLVLSILIMAGDGGSDQFLFATVAAVLALVGGASFISGFFSRKRFFGFIGTLSLAGQLVLWWPLRGIMMPEYTGGFSVFGSVVPVSQFILVNLLIGLIVMIAALVKYDMTVKEGSFVLYPMFEKIKSRYSLVFLNPFSEQKLKPTAVVLTFIAAVLIIGISAFKIGEVKNYSEIICLEDNKVLLMDQDKVTTTGFKLPSKKPVVIVNPDGNQLFSIEKRTVSDVIPDEDTIKAKRIKSYEVVSTFLSSEIIRFYIVGLVLAGVSVVFAIAAFFIKSRKFVLSCVCLNLAQMIFWLPVKISMGVPVSSVFFIILLFVGFYTSLKTVFKSDLASFIIKTLFFIILIAMFSAGVDFGNLMETGISWVQSRSNGMAFSDSIKSTVQGFAAILNSVSWFVVASVISLLLIVIRKDLVLGLVTFVTLFFIEYMGIWSEAMETMALVIFSTLLALILGIPQGIIAAFSKGFQRFITPVLDFMQTMPAFVYLIPAVAFFGLGEGPAVFATLIFAIPPCIRFTALGIRQIDHEFTEAADSFGSTRLQKLVKIQVPMAIPTIMAGINQTIMLSLSMVVIASMVGTGGLGKIVFQAVNQLKLGNGFEGGIAVVIIAIILDRISQSIRNN